MPTTAPPAPSSMKRDDFPAPVPLDLHDRPHVIPLLHRPTIPANAVAHHRRHVSREEHAHDRLHDVVRVSAAPDLRARVLDPRDLEDLVDDRVRRQTEPDGTWAELDARRPELVLHLRPNGAVLEPLDVVHVAHGLRERLVERAQEVGALALSETEEAVPVADDDEHGETLDLTANTTKPDALGIDGHATSIGASDRPSVDSSVTSGCWAQLAAGSSDVAMDAILTPSGSSCDAADRSSIALDLVGQSANRGHETEVLLLHTGDMPSRRAPVFRIYQARDYDLLSLGCSLCSAVIFSGPEKHARPCYVVRRGPFAVVPATQYKLNDITISLTVEADFVLFLFHVHGLALAESQALRPAVML
ncbi:hypothetical protein NUW54_g8713 [Trametes sanguinea]|uniref:Uncharacterized protein n=1 Tax=Trametes sanguinea TaxID=158606 RepID=A0ACC1PBW1_9APHY|nr:hypothetical protein NUW54_g8713 [Trametes sanguinea]